VSEGRPLLVHGFVHAEIAETLSELLGSRAETLIREPSRSGIVALATELGSADPARDFADPKTVTALALDHAHVLAVVSGAHDVAPLRLGTLVSGREALRELCEAQSGAAVRALRAIGGQVEFGLRALPAPEADRAPQERPVDGRAYLRARSMERSGNARRSEAQRDFCASLADRIGAICRVRSLGSEAVRLAKGRLIDLACLVDRRRVDAFAEAVEAEAALAREQGISLETTGPWPPYSFVAAEAC
jgi:hypothetical protein